MKELFVSKNFSKSSLLMIQQASDIIDQYQAQGYRLSLRQLYYQMVARGLIDNVVKEYDRLGACVSEARLAGLLDWDMIEDRNREVVTPPMYRDPAHIVDVAVRAFAIDRWENQDNYVEVMVEKAALEGVLAPVCREFGVRFTSNKGYCSSSTMYEAGKRVEDEISRGKVPYVLYLGDHDPSGIDMTRDVRDRLSMFSYSNIEVVRVALNMDQIEVLHPPENPAKLTDSRAQGYILQYGMSSWELDAIEPRALANLVTSTIINLRDDDAWNERMALEEKMRDDLRTFVKTYKRPED